MKISIFGLGYVGVVSSACFAKLGHNIVGVDVIDYKVNAVNSGKAPIEEKGLNELVALQVKEGRLKATKNSQEAIMGSDISFVCVGTPPKENGDLDLSILEGVCAEIGKALKNKQYHLIVIRSTMFPGSLDRLKEIIEKNSGKLSGKDFDIATNPEFLREGSAVKDFFNPPYIIIGAEKKEIGNNVLKVYDGIKSKLFVVNPGVAQMIKYASNSWHALKVDFANEIGAICNKAGVDGRELMKLFSEDNQLNISSYYMMPGFAYGGSCLPKDTAALKNNAKKFGIKVPLINSINESNLEQIKRATELIESSGKKKIGFLGVTFKSGTDDIRGNPLLMVLNSLLNKSYEVKIFDKLIDKSNVEMINESYRKEIFDLISRENLKEKVETISGLFSDLNSVLKQDVVVISHRDLSLKEELNKLSSEQWIIDLQNIFSEKDFKARYKHL